MLLGVDVGGTFTDAVVYDGRSLHTAKAPTTPDDQSRGVLAAVDAALERAGARADEIEAFAHGMTVGTNALLTESGARTALVATAGFTDLLDVGRQNRPHLYRLCAPKPVPLVEPELRFEAAERVAPEGVVEPLGEDEPERLAAAIAASGAMTRSAELGRHRRKATAPTSHVAPTKRSVAAAEYFMPTAKPANSAECEACRTDPD